MSSSSERSLELFQAPPLACPLRSLRSSILLQASRSQRAASDAPLTTRHDIPLPYSSNNISATVAKKYCSPKLRAFSRSSDGVVVLYGTPIDTGLLALGRDECNDVVDDDDESDIDLTAREDASAEGSDLETLNELRFLLLAKPKRETANWHLDASSVCSDATRFEFPTPRGVRRQKTDQNHATREIRALRIVCVLLAGFYCIIPPPEREIRERCISQAVPRGDGDDSARVRLRARRDRARYAAARQPDGCVERPLSRSASQTTRRALARPGTNERLCAAFIFAVDTQHRTSNLTSLSLSLFFSLGE